MNRRDFLRVASASTVGTIAIAEGKLGSIATASGSTPAGESAGPKRTSDAHGAMMAGLSQQPNKNLTLGQDITKADSTRREFVISGQLIGNYSADVGQIMIGLPGDNKSADILSDGSFAFDVPRDTLIDVAYVERTEDEVIYFNGNPDVYYIETLEQVSKDQELGKIEIPEANVLDLQFKDKSGEPLDGITTAVRSLNTETDRWWQIFVSTNTEGFYQSNNSPTGIEVHGDVQIAVLEDTNDSRVPDLDVVVDETLNVTEPRFESYTIDPITVNGRLTRTDNTPITGDTVSVYTNTDDSADVATDQEGEFEIQLPESSNFTQFTYEIQYYRAGLLEQDKSITEGNWVEMYAGPQLDGTIDQDFGTIQLPEGDLVTAQVVDEAGSPVEGATIQYVHRNQEQGSAAALFYSTDETGVIDLSGRSGIRLSGRVTLAASPPDSDRFADTTVEETISVDGASTVELELPDKNNNFQFKFVDDSIGIVQGESYAIEVAFTNNSSDTTSQTITYTLENTDSSVLIQTRKEVSVDAGTSEKVTFDITQSETNTLELGNYTHVVSSNNGDISMDTQVTNRNNSSPLNGTPSNYDTNGDGEITASELGTAGLDFAQGKLTAAELGEIGLIFAQS